MKANNNLPVKLRQKPTKKGVSLYLETNTNGKTTKQYLKLYLLNGTTPKIKAYNANVMEQAKQEQAKAVIALTNEENAPKAKAKNLTLQDIIEEVKAEKERTGKTESTLIAYDKLLTRVNLFCKNRKQPLQKVDVTFCENFVLYLKDTNCINLQRNNKNAKNKETYLLEKFGARSANAIFVTFKTIMKYALCKGYISKNPIVLLNDDYKITFEPTERGYLSIKEVKQIEHINTGLTDIAKEVKRAFLFACYTGLRISDIFTLCTNDIQEVEGVTSVKKKMRKTGANVCVPLNKKALQYLGTPNAKGLFFDLPTLPNVNVNLKKIAELANINKNVSFHISRHTFATMLLTKGADLYTTSKLLGHKNISVTQIYADIINKKKENAVNLLD